MDKQKIFWVVLSVSIFIVVVLVVGVFLLKQGPSAATSDMVSPLSNTATRIYEYGQQKPQAPQASQPQAPQIPAVEPTPAEPEVLKIVIGEESAKKAAPEKLPEPMPPKAAVATPAPTPAPEVKQPAPQQKAVAQKPPAQKPPAAKPAAPPAPVKFVEYWIQTGSYKSQTMAEELAHTLADKGLSGRVFSYASGKDTYFRVRIGPYANKSEAGKFLDLVKQIQGLESSYISLVRAVRAVN
jgi:cell division septation protein DedD